MRNYTQKEQALDESQQSKVLMVSDVGISYYHGYEGGESWSEGSIKQVRDGCFPEGVTGPFRLLLDRSRWRSEQSDGVCNDHSER